MIVTVPLLVALLWFVGQTKYGKAMRATAQDPDAARLMGIDVDRTIALTFLLGGLMAGAAGPHLRALQRHHPLQPGLHRRPDRVHRGGHGRHRQPQGRRVGGLIIGVIQAISATTSTSARPQWTPAVVFGDPDPGHGLPAAGPVRRGDARGMTRAPTASDRGCAATTRHQRRRDRHAARAVAVVACSFLRWRVYPPICESRSDLLDASIQTLAYMIMALGLNIVVGFAGLLDLGYVAFYAIGAFVIGWFGSQQFPTSTARHPHPRHGVRSDQLPGHPLNFFVVIAHRRRRSPRCGA